MSESENIPYGYCQCGCGEKAPIAQKTKSALGHRKGEPIRFINHHHGRRSLRSRYTVDSSTGCWNWTGRVRSNGYGSVDLPDGRQRAAHRAMYEELRGPVPDHLDLDHLCRNRLCGNPDHLEPVTRSENLRRGARGKMTLASIFALRLADASTSLPRLEVAEMINISGRTATRYLGTAGRGRYGEQRRRRSPVGHEHGLTTSCQDAPYPDI